MPDIEKKGPFYGRTYVYSYCDATFTCYRMYPTALERDERLEPFTDIRVYGVLKEPFTN